VARPAPARSTSEPQTTRANPDAARPSPWGAWERFFFTPADPLPLALVRIVVAVTVAWSILWLGIDLADTFGPHAWANPQTARVMMPPHTWSLWLILPDGLLLLAWGVNLACVLLLALGLLSPVVAVLTWVFAVSTLRRIPVMLFGFDIVSTTWLLYLAVCGASGQSLSLDRWLKNRWPRWPFVPRMERPTTSANLGLRLIQLHLCLIYASAGLSKLRGTPWWDGTALGMLLGNTEFRPIDLSFLANHPRFLELGTHTALALELTYPILVWFRGWRPWMVGAALLMHTGIAVMMGLTEFSLVMIAGNLAFVSGAWLRKVRGRLWPATRHDPVRLESTSTAARPRR
jgi:hypothetical protein